MPLVYISKEKLTFVFAFVDIQLCEQKGIIMECNQPTTCVGSNYNPKKNLF